MADDDEIECTFTPTINDYVIRRRYLLFGKSGQSLGKLIYIYVAIFGVVIVTSVLHAFQMYKFGIVDHRDIGNAVLFAMLILFMLFGDALVLAIALRNEAGAFGPLTVRLTPDYAYTKSTVSESYSRWRVYNRVDFNQGDVYLVISKLFGVRVPGRAFASASQGERAYMLASHYHGAANIGIVTPASAQAGGEPTVADDSVWPPSPKNSALAKPLPDIGPPIEISVTLNYILTVSDQLKVYRAAAFRQLMRSALVMICTYAVVLAVISLVIGSSISWPIVITYGIVMLLIFAYSFFKQIQLGRKSIVRDIPVHLDTDFETVWIKTDTANVSYLASAIHRIRIDAAYVYTSLSPLAVFAIPLHAFASPTDARDFVDRLRAAKRAAKR